MPTEFVRGNGTDRKILSLGASREAGSAVSLFLNFSISQFFCFFIFLFLYFSVSSIFLFPLFSCFLYFPVSSIFLFPESIKHRRTPVGRRKQVFPRAAPALKSMKIGFPLSPALRKGENEGKNRGRQNGFRVVLWYHPESEREVRPSKCSATNSLIFSKTQTADGISNRALPAPVKPTAISL